MSIKLVCCGSHGKMITSRRHNDLLTLTTCIPMHSVLLQGTTYVHASHPARSLFRPRAGMSALYSPPYGDAGGLIMGGYSTSEQVQRYAYPTYSLPPNLVFPPFFSSSASTSPRRFAYRARSSCFLASFCSLSASRSAWLTIIFSFSFPKNDLRLEDEMDAVSIGGGASSWRGWCHTERGGVAFMSTCRFESNRLSLLQGLTGRT